MFICLLSPEVEAKVNLVLPKSLSNDFAGMHLMTHAQNLTSFKKPCDLKRKCGLQLGVLYLALQTAFCVPSKVWDIASQEACLATLMGCRSVPRFAFSRLGGIGM